jgi:type IV pilus assembly protein PilY1
VPVTGSNAGGGGTTLAVALTPNPQTKAGTPNTTISTAGGTPDTLADVAMYYYKTDLRTSGPLALNNVPQSGADFTNTQHMTTFTLGLGLQGNMDYQADYPSNPASDFAKIKSAAKGCTFSGAGTCDWPAPVSGTPSTLDDLWHAAVNGRGLYFSASDPNSLAAGLSGALAAIDQQTGAAAASATSSQTLTSTSNLVFASTFRTVKWDGEITAQHLDPATGGIQQVKDPVTGLLVASPLVWSADAQLDAQVAATSDTRKIYMFTGAPTFPTKLKDFTFANMSTVSVVGGLSAQNSFFINQCVAMSQCPSLTSAGANVSGGAGATTGQHGDANDGNLLVNYLRGQKSMETAGIFRIRDHALGDPVDSKPVYVQGSIFGFTDNVSPPYSDFQKINNSASTPRQAALYVGANDGMLHALNADTGSEMWAYVPRMVFPQLSKIASFNWSVQHTYSVDGSPEIMDIYDPTAGAWKTILVSGLNKGGRGYFALDVTDPKNPKGLWEICSDSAVCRIAEPNMGYSYGNPVITTRSLDGGFTTQPVVIFTSGYNNVSPGDGGGWLFVVDAFTGKVLERVPTSAGTTTTPSGLAKVAAFAENFFTKNLTTFVYGGDLLGNLWRFDMSVSPPTTLLMTSFKDAKGNPQSITTRPELGVISKNRYIFVGTGRYLGPSDLGDPSLLVPPEQWAYQNSLYAVKDTGANITNPRSTFIQQTLIDSGGITRTTSNNNVNPGTDSWFIDFNPGNTSPGERVDTDPTLVLGTLVLHTNIPNNNACSTGGDFFTYFFNFATGTYVSTSTNNVAGTRTYGSLVVGSNVVRTSTGAIISLDTTDQGKLKPSQAPIGGVPGSGRRVSWRELLK